MENIFFKHTHDITKRLLSQQKLEKIKDSILVRDNLILKLKQQVVNILSEEVLDVYIYIYNNFSVEVSINDFEKYINTELIDEIENSFPFLISLLKNKHNNITKYINELIKNIEDTYHSTGIEEIFEIHLNSGDSHNEGRFTVQIETNVGSYFYKPRTSHFEKRFVELVSSYIKDYHFQIFNFSNFSICEKINYFSPIYESERKHFFYNQGIISALLYYMNSSDNHYENLIVHKEKPYYIDLECFYRRKRSKIFSNNTQNEFLENIDSSIFRTGIFPISISDTYMNISALTGRKEKIVNNHYSYNDYTMSNNKIISIPYEAYTSSQKNLIKNNDNIIEPHFYKSEIIEGFKKVSYDILKNKESFIIKVKDILCNSDTFIRYIYRPTHIYDSTLKLLREPYYRMSLDNAKKAIDNLKMDDLNNNSEIYRYEVQELLNGDIPIFYSHNYDMILGDGTIIPNYFIDTLEESIIKNIQKITKSSVTNEIRNIEKSLILNDYNTEFPCYYKQNEITFDQAFKRLIDYKDEAIQSNYVHVSFQTGIATISYSNNYLYEIGGIILSNVVISYINNDKIIEYLKLLKEKKMLYSNDISITTGISSYIYILLKLYEDSNNETFYKCEIDDALVLLKSKIESGNVNEIDYFSGLAGALAILNKIYSFFYISKNVEISLSKESLQYLIKKTYSQILDQLSNQIGAGFAHGLSGIIFSLNKTFQNFPSKYLYNSIHYLLKREEDFYLQDENNYLDIRSNITSGLFLCYGLPGILQTRMRLNNQFKNDVEIKMRLNRLIEDILNGDANIPKNLSICHGIASLLELFIDAYNFKYITEKEFGKVTTVLKKRAKNLKLPYFGKNINFGLGLTGYYYTIIKLDNLYYPSFFFLD